MVRINFDGEVRTGTLERRYKRFFADVQLDLPGARSGPAAQGAPRAPRALSSVVTAHTPNTGAMTGLVDAGNPVLVTYRPSKKRKLDYSLEAVFTGTSWVGTNTMLPNRLVEKAIAQGEIAGLEGYRTIDREVVAPISSSMRSRIDIVLRDHVDAAPDAWVEVKSVTLRLGDHALFPDAVSERGRRHIETLRALHAQGLRAVFVFLVQRTDCAAFSPAGHVDPDYARALYDAYEAGVEVVAVTARVDDSGVCLGERLPLDFLPIPASG